jgi:hypothetical protein
MEDRILDVEPGMLCSCCNNDSLSLPELEGISARQRETIKELCKVCLEKHRLKAVND